MGRVENVCMGYRQREEKSVTYSEWKDGKTRNPGD